MPGSARFTVPLAASILALVTLAGCELDWGEARVGLETPGSPDADRDTAGTTGGEPRMPPLPEGPLLVAVRIEPDGRAVAAPAARMTPRGPTPLELPSDPPARWWELFADSLQAAGTELPLYTTGRRVGTLILTAGRESVNEGCPDAVAGRVLLPPGTESPELAFAWAPTPGSAAPPPEPPMRPASTRRLRVFAPILAERLLREADVENPFLARRAALEPVTFPGDTALGMAATYLINDSLAPVPPPGGPSASLFFLARFDRSEGYVPVWSRIASYGDTAGKEVLEHLDWLPVGEERVEILRRTGARSARMAAARNAVDGGSELTWTASERCPVLETLRAASPAARDGEGQGG